MKTRIFLEGEDILAFLEEYIFDLQDGDILIITSKIIALAESRTFIPNTEKDKLTYIKKEGVYLGKTKYVHLSIVDGIYTANAGIDESNANGKCILLPKNSYQSAYDLWLAISEKYHLPNFGIIITDSRTTPLRKGTTGVSLGHMGFEGIYDYVGKQDIFGRTFHFSRVNVVDSLATAAVYTMGEGDECRPLAIIKDSNVAFTHERQYLNNLSIDVDEDMYNITF